METNNYPFVMEDDVVFVSNQNLPTTGTFKLMKADPDGKQMSLTEEQQQPAEQHVELTHEQKRLIAMKLIRGDDIEEYYKRMCVFQREEALKCVSKEFLAKLPIIVHEGLDKKEIAVPLNHKRLADMQLEAFKHSPHVRALETKKTDRVDKKDANTPNKKRKTQKLDELKSNEVLEREHFIENHRHQPHPAPSVHKDTHKEPKEKKKKSKKKNSESDDADPSRVLIQKLHQEVQALNLASRKPTSKVVIIGAGIAGVAAARELASLGFTVTVLEARDRIGGRIHTITSEELAPGAGIDIGAAFIHGTEGNPITKLCQTLGEVLYTPQSECTLYDVDGKPLDAQVDAELEKLFNQFLDGTDKLRNKEGHNVSRKFLSRNTNPTVTEEKKVPSVTPTVPQADTSLGKALNEILFHWQKQKGPIKQIEWRILNWHFANIEGPCGADISLLSLQKWDQDDPYEFDGDHCVIREGYGHLVNALASGLDIRLNHKVDSIDYRDGKSIRIVTPKGHFDADAVIVTLPLGVLKQNSVQFMPPLPTDKQTAISKLGFGLLNKLVLFFPKAFWKTESDYIGYTSQTRGEFYLFINMMRVVGAPVLVIMIAGQAAQNAEALSGEEVVSKALGVLRTIYGNVVPNPTRAVITRWGSDPFTFGSFSYLAVGSSGDDYDLLAKPVLDKIFFAGEATIRHHPSTVSGAYMSGVRAAYELAKSCTLRENQTFAPVHATSARQVYQVPQPQQFLQAPLPLEIDKSKVPLLAEEVDMSSL